ncbi:hypothetical protein AMJ87_07785 [candidate division WOR_3 bacterium SM23_60]|uniref:Glycosyltransferase subfamily 4-like N-terminal domain-containing protein n=1 Tax=candidate division WOR_3 bacterium SM23_60 TaxID=1703780 RepID=A0A0S8GDJ7_UNCW3|nr:MAG: hypothetical protein AMJ87_07785 [candidate division WOR_3 bacterium SM23_60]
MISIGYVINNLPVGGAEILLLNLIKHLDKNKYRPFIYTIRRHNPLKHEFTRIGATLRELNLKSNTQFWRVLKLSNLFTSDRIDIIHTHLCDADIYGRIAGKIARKNNIISTEHSMNTWKRERKPKQRLRSMLDLFTTRFCRRVVCISQAVRDFVTEWGVAYDKTVVIYPSKPVTPIRISKISKRKELDVAPKDFVVTHVGRFTREKNQRTLVRGALSVLQSHDDITFLMIGDGPQRKELVELVQTSGFSNKILFLGTRNDIAEILCASDLFVLPSLREGFGITIIEAMQQRLPVIASNIGGIPELVDENTGILVSPSKAEEFAESIVMLYKNQNLCRRLGKNGYQKAEQKFNFAHHVEQITALYDSLIEIPPSSSTVSN